MENKSDLELLNAALSKWVMISCEQFQSMLYHDPKLDVYETEGKIVEKDDPRLIAYKEAFKKMKPTDLRFL